MVALGGLAVFGRAYDRFVTGLEESGHDEGYTALLVVAGVLVTLLGAALLRVVVLRMYGMTWDQSMALAVLLFACDFAAFAASGVSMVWGSWQRYSRKRQNGQNEMRDRVAK